MRTPVPVPGYRAHIDRYVVDDKQVVYLSLLGPFSVVKAIWATLMQGNSTELWTSFWAKRLTLDGNPNAYFTKTSLLPDTEHAHLVTVCQQATPQAFPEGPLYGVFPGGGDATAQEASLYIRLRQLGHLPIKREWMPWLTHEITRQGLLVDLTHHRDARLLDCDAFRLSLESDRWEAILSRGIRERHIR